MKKTGIALAVLLVAAGAAGAGAWYTGKQVESLLGDKVAEANDALRRQLPGSEINLQLVALERGVFSSQARYRVDLGELAVDLPSSELVLVERIEHGPLPLSRLLRLQWRPVLTHGQARLERNALSAPLFEMSGEAEPLTLATTLHYNRTASVAIELAPLRVAAPHYTLDFSGFSGTLAGDREHLRGHGGFQRLELRAADPSPARLEVRGVHFEVDRTLSPSGLFQGEQSGRVARLDIQLPELAPLVLSGIDLRDRVSEDAGRLAAEFGSRVEEVRYGDAPLGALELNWSVRDLQIAALRELAELLALHADALGDEAGHGGLSPSQEEQLRQALYRLLASQPQLNLERLALRTRNAESQLRIALTLNRPEDGELTPEAFLRQLLARLNIELELPKATIRDLVGYQALLDPILDAEAVALEAGMLAEMAGEMAVALQLAALENDTLTSRLSYAEGRVTFNGNSMPVEEFTALLSMLMGSGME